MQFPAKAAQYCSYSPTVSASQLSEMDWDYFEEGADMDQINIHREMIDELPMPAGPIEYDSANANLSLEGNWNGSPAQHAGTALSQHHKARCASNAIHKVC